MEEKTFNISQIANATSVQELDSIREVQILAFGPKRHHQMIEEYNSMLDGYHTINNEIRAKEEEVVELKRKGFIPRLFKGKKYDERVAVLLEEIEDAKGRLQALDKKTEDALNEIRAIEKEMLETERFLVGIGLSLQKFMNIYNAKRRELIQASKNPKSTQYALSESFEVSKSTPADKSWKPDSTCSQPSAE